MISLPKKELEAHFHRLNDYRKLLDELVKESDPNSLKACVWEEYLVNKRQEVEFSLSLLRELFR